MLILRKFLTMKFNEKRLAAALKYEPDREKHPAILRRIFSFQENIELFASFFFKSVLTSPTPDFHSEIYDMLFSEGNTAVAAPRGHAKSTITGLIFLIYCIVNKLERYIVYVSQNHSKTVQFLQPIRDEFKNNNMLKYVYGDLNVLNARSEDGKDREDCFDVNGIRIEAVSFEKNLRGFKYKNIRPTLIICDDIEDDQRVLNPELREKDSSKLNKIIIPSLDIDGRVKIIGTILHVHSLLKQKIEQYDGKIYKACDSSFNNILWPERFTEKKLRQIHWDIGTVSFEQEYLNNPVNTKNALIQREWLDRCKDEELSYTDVERWEYDYKTIGVDFAFSDRITADKSAFVSLGKYKDQFICFNLMTRKGLSVSRQLDIIEMLNSNYAYDAIGLEENSIKAISSDLSNYSMPITLFWTSSNDPATKRKADYNYLGKRHTVGKTALIMRLGTALEHEEIVFPYKTREDKNITEAIFSELISFALADGKLVEAGVHPDIPIGLGYALELQKYANAVVIDYGEVSE